MYNLEYIIHPHKILSTTPNTKKWLHPFNLLGTSQSNKTIEIYNFITNLESSGSVTVLQKINFKLNLTTTKEYKGGFPTTMFNTLFSVNYEIIDDIKNYLSNIDVNKLQDSINIFLIEFDNTMSNLLYIYLNKNTKILYLTRIKLISQHNIKNLFIEE